MNDVIVRMEHLREMKYCSRGIREFFFAHNLDFADFLENGIQADVLLTATDNDAMAVAAVEVANGWIK